MAYTVQKTLPTVSAVHAQFPLTPELAAKIEQDRKEIEAIIEGKDSRKILIVGPCSAWPSEAVIEYAKALKPIQEKYADKLKIIMRVYIQKPRTTVGWVGPVNQPDPYAEPDIEKGLFYCREMMIKVLELGFPIADEAVYTHKKGYFTDLYSWIAIGARSAEDQEHRIFASMIDHPVGMKNPTSGDLATGVNSVIAAQWPHVFVINGQQIRTSGNPHAHLILRGGADGRNCDLESMQMASQILADKKVENPSILADISHDNSIDPVTGKKNPMLQPQILMQVVEDMKTDPLVGKTVKGFMVESFLQDGAQNMKNCTSQSELEYGQSITDGCIGIEGTKKMIEDLANTL